MVVLGYAWGIDFPIIKKIWTSSMVVLSTGYCCLLLGVLYYLVDVMRISFPGERLFLVYGVNSIAAYMLALCVDFNSVGNSLLYGFGQYLGDFYPVLIAVSNSVIIFLILYYMYRNKIFLKV